MEGDGDYRKGRFEGNLRNYGSGNGRGSFGWMLP